MENAREKIPEYLIRVMILRFLDSQYPAKVDYEGLEQVMERVNCSSREVTRVLAYLKEKKFLEGVWADSDDIGLLPGWLSVKITAEGIDYLESLEEKIRLEVEEKEREAGFDGYRQQQEKKNK